MEQNNKDNSLLNIVIEKNKRIEDLESLVDEQRRLRLQDASQVEEKAARIKEWVANKLKELENQNKLLRDQNKKQKEIIELLTKQLANTKLAQKMTTRESPVYDSVNIEQIQNVCLKPNKQNEIIAAKQQSPPPPPPLHQSDKWEMQLYNLADQTLNTLMKQQSQQSDEAEDCSRKSSLSSKNDLILLVKPSFTTIDGDHVVDSLDYESEGFEEDNSISFKQVPKDNLRSYERQNSNEQNSSHQQHFKKLIKKDSLDSNDSFTPLHKTSSMKPPITTTTTTSNMFDSPMRSRSGKDTVLRTQSVRRNPAPGKLYDFLLADLVKRGYLVKPGALKNHQRWFVLKNFHLLSYKTESEETLKATPTIKIKLNYNCQVQALSQNGDSSFPFKISYLDKSLQLIAPTAQCRDEWIRILTVTINMSDIEPDALTKNNSTFEGMMSITMHGHNKRCHAILVDHIVFFLKSLTDPTPMSYISVKDAKIREITDSYDYDFDAQDKNNNNNSNNNNNNNNIQDCSLAIYPKFSMNPDPIYITLGSQQDTDKWLYFLSMASNLDQSHGTQFERALTKMMISNSIGNDFNSTTTTNHNSIDNTGGVNCLWKEHSLMLYNDKPITQPLTSLPNETLQVEAIELSKSILLFSQVPLEPIAIDYHVSLLKNCLFRFLKYPELRNEFYAQLIKQSTWILHRCNISPKSSISNYSDNSQDNQRSSSSSMSPSSTAECQFLTDIRLLSPTTNHRLTKTKSIASNHSSNHNKSNGKEHKLNELLSLEEDIIVPPAQSELIQIMQILAVAVSLNLPRGRMRWWLIDHLRKFADPETNIGKYALYTLKAIDRTLLNGTRDNVPSRTEIMSILLRNPYDHSNPHSLPVNFCDGSYLVVGADGSTTVEEFMNSMTKDIDIRHSILSDFYLFSDDPSGDKELHILEPKRKVLDIVGWWEESFRKSNSGRYQNTKFIRLLCKKRLVLKAEVDETYQERVLIVHQMNREIVTTQNIQLNENLTLELAAIMTQLTFGDYERNSQKTIKSIFEKVLISFLPNKSSQNNVVIDDCKKSFLDEETCHQLLKRWQHLSGKSSQDCIRVYLNCVRRLNLGS